MDILSVKINEANLTNIQLLVDFHFDIFYATGEWFGCLDQFFIRLKFSWKIPAQILFVLNHWQYFVLYWAVQFRFWPKFHELPHELVKLAAPVLWAWIRPVAHESQEAVKCLMYSFCWMQLMRVKGWPIGPGLVVIGEKNPDGERIVFTNNRIVFQKWVTNWTGFFLFYQNKLLSIVHKPK